MRISFVFVSIRVSYDSSLTWKVLYRYWDTFLNSWVKRISTDERNKAMKMKITAFPESSKAQELKKRTLKRIKLATLHKSNLEVQPGLRFRDLTAHEDSSEMGMNIQPHSIVFQLSCVLSKCCDSIIVRWFSMFMFENYQ